MQAPARNLGRDPLDAFAHCGRNVLRHREAHRVALRQSDLADFSRGKAAVLQVAHRLEHADADVGNGRTHEDLRVARDPQVFVGSAIADVSVGVFQAVRDLQDGRFPTGEIRKIGLAQRDAVRLTMAQDVSAAVRERIERVAAEIAGGRLHVPTTYDGPEFATPA